MTQTLDLSCPKCGSEQTQKITSVVAGGTSISSSRTSGVGVGAVGGTTAVFATGATTRGHQQTVLAQKLAQPQRVSMLKFWALALVAAVLAMIPAVFLSEMGFNFLALVALIAMQIWFWRWAVKRSSMLLDYNENIYPRDIVTWRKGYFCHRCESVFVPD